MRKQLWETRPLKCWNKAKEMREKYDRSVREAHQEEVLLAQTGLWSLWTLAMPAIRPVEDNPIGAMMQFQSSKFSRECRLATEIAGWGREICGYQLNCWGAQYLDRQVDGTKFPRRDLVIPMPDPCDQHTKRGQLPMDESNIPRWQADWPIYTGPDDVTRDKAFVENRVNVILDIIEDCERVTGQKLDDEKLITMMSNLWAYTAYFREICEMMRNIPAPLSQKDLYSFYTLGRLTLTDPEETKAMWKEFRDEIEWRVQHKIAAVANERYRYMETHPPPWHFLNYYRYLEKYGAVCIGSQYTHSGGGGQYEWREDGTWGQSKTPLELGVPLKTREDVIRAYYSLPRGATMKVDEIIHPYLLQDYARAFKVDGAILPLWRGGVGCTYLRKEQGRRLSEIGVRVMHYEGTQPGDRTDLDEERFLDQLDVWMESQGLRKLEN